MRALIRLAAARSGQLRWLAISTADKHAARNDIRT
jgi:hypothetical protein